MSRIMWTEREMLEALRDVVLDEGRGVTLKSFRTHSGVPESQIRREFGSWEAMRRKAGLRKEDRNRQQIPDETLWQEYNELVKQYRRLPTPAQIDRYSPFSSRTYQRRFGTQEQIKQAFRRWLTQQHFPTENDRITNVTADAAREGTADVAWLRQRWRQLKVTFEVRSSDFRERPVQDWELLVVLEHDWPGAPITVLELGEVAGNPRRPGDLEMLDAALVSTRAELYGRMPWETSLLEEAAAAGRT
jgi:hypothetical protein